MIIIITYQGTQLLHDHISLLVLASFITHTHIELRNSEFCCQYEKI